ncbi:unnamed protein product [Diamesa serratosioi]
MTETELPSKNSMKLDITKSTSAENNSEKQKESYKVIEENGLLDHVTGDTVKNSNMVRENGDTAMDGADEKMLGSDEKAQLAVKNNIEVKFISGDQNGTNGDAKIDVGVVEKTFTGMTKDELMKYANDPFWVRLRWVLFIFFWALWVAMLAGAIAIIIYAPKCAAPSPLAWYKKGPMVTINGEETDTDLADMKSFEVKGVIYEIPADQTYQFESVEAKVKELVERYRAQSIHVVVDLTPNYVTKDDKLFKDAITDAKYRSAFVWSETDPKPNNWLEVNGTETAWKAVDQNQGFVLSQFGTERADLQMSSPYAQEKLLNLLGKFIELGVKGFRLANAKHFLIDKELKNEAKRDVTTYDHRQYGYYKHLQTTFQDGLGDVMYNLTKFVHNKTEDDGFLSIRDNIADNAHVFKVSGTQRFIGYDLPFFGFVKKNFEGPADVQMVAGNLFTDFSYVNHSLGENIWLQWQYSHKLFSNFEASAYNMFMMLLPGVPIVTIDTLNYSDMKKADIIVELEKARESPVFQHGKFDFLTDVNNTVFGYTRVKSGNPAYFVVLNPLERNASATFITPLFDELTVYLLSDSYKDNDGLKIKDKKGLSNIPLAPRSVAIFTFIPKDPKA